MIEDYWAGGDPDDVSGYLLDYLNSELSIDGVIMSDEALDEFIRNDEAGKIEEILYNIRNALRAKNADF